MKSFDEILAQIQQRMFDEGEQGRVGEDLEGEAFQRTIEFMILRTKNIKEMLRTDIILQTEVIKEKIKELREMIKKT
jgi:hypothetical protein